MRTINTIVVHCTATPEGRSISVADITRWHREAGYTTIGYHWVVGLNGEIWPGRAESLVGAHAKGANTGSIGICYVGGLAKDGKTAKDTRTAAQKVSLLKLIRDLKAKYPAIKTVIGHRDVPGTNKECPSFNAKAEYAVV